MGRGFQRNKKVCRTRRVARVDLVIANTFRKSRVETPSPPGFSHSWLEEDVRDVQPRIFLNVHYSYRRQQTPQTMLFWLRFSFVCVCFI